MSTAAEIETLLKVYIEGVRIRALKILEVEGLKSIRQNFQAEGRPTRWEPRKLGTAYAAKMSGHKILRGMTNRLFSMTTAKADFEGSKVEIGNNIIYGRIHQEGGMAGRNLAAKIPARPYLIIPPEDFPRIIKQVERAVKK